MHKSRSECIASFLACNFLQSNGVLIVGLAIELFKCVIRQERKRESSCVARASAAMIMSDSDTGEQRNVDDIYYLNIPIQGGHSYKIYTT